MKSLYESLVTYAQAAGARKRAGYAPIKCHWSLDLNPDGTPAGPLLPLTSTEPAMKQGQTDRVNGYVKVESPMFDRRGTGPQPWLGTDRLDYVFGWKQLRPGDRTKASAAGETAKLDKYTEGRHQAWMELAAAWAASDIGSADLAARALVGFAQQHLASVRIPDEAGSGDTIQLSFDGQPIGDATSAAEFWARHLTTIKGAGYGLCLACHREGALMASFPSGVAATLIPNGGTTKVTMSSINTPAFGWNLEMQLAHVPICGSCTDLLPATLNGLLADDNHRHRTPTSVVVWWTENGAQFNPMHLIREATPSDVAAVFAQVAVGRQASVQDLSMFNSATLRAENGRLVVRDWLHMPVVDMQVNVAAWFDDLAVAQRPGHPQHRPLWRLVAATGRWLADTSRYEPGTFANHRWSDPHRPHSIDDDLIRTALSNRPIPTTITAHVLRRIAADGHVDADRTALLKLHLSRSTKETFMADLDLSRTDTTYLLGRLFAVYEQTQIDAARCGGGQTPNATISDRYLRSAAASPRIVLGVVAGQASAWHSKLRKAGRDFQARDADQIIARIGESDIPARADLNEQCLFMLGYHQQRAHTAARIAEHQQRKKSSGSPSSPDSPN